MTRKDFISTGCIACLGATSILGFLASCVTSSAMVEAPIKDSDLLVSLDDFKQSGSEGKFKNYVVVSNDKLYFPICVYRLNATTYTALLMKCTHQGAELQVFGEKMACPAHGSEFNNRGTAITGPAVGPLRSFPVTIFENKLKISLV